MLRVGVIGAGIMGGGIAYQAALSNIPAVMKDIEGSALDAGMAEAEDYLAAALASARETGSIALALRAAEDLAALHMENGDEEVARALLAETHEEMPEQFHDQGELRTEPI